MTIKHRLSIFSIVFLLSLVACSEVSGVLEDAAVVLEDASAMLRDAADSTVDAQATGATPIVLDCADAYSLTITADAGGPGEAVETSSGFSSSVVVDRPSDWLVERCGRVMATDGVVADFGGCNRPTVTCEGTTPPVFDCTLSPPTFTGNTIHAICGTTVQIQSSTFSRLTVTTYTSVRLVPR